MQGRGEEKRGITLCVAEAQRAVPTTRRARPGRPQIPTPRPSEGLRGEFGSAIWQKARRERFGPLPARALPAEASDRGPHRPGSGSGGIRGISSGSGAVQQRRRWRRRQRGGAVPGTLSDADMQQQQAGGEQQEQPQPAAADAAAAAPPANDGVWGGFSPYAYLGEVRGFHDTPWRMAGDSFAALNLTGGWGRYLPWAVCWDEPRFADWPSGCSWAPLPCAAVPPHRGRSGSLLQTAYWRAAALT